MAEILYEDIRKSFGGVEVIKGLSLRIHDGEFFTFVGPSGCGKSTILNITAGLENATGGVISFDGRPVNDLSPGDRDVAMVFQSYALYPHLAVYENLAFPLKMKKERRDIIDREVRRVARLLGIDGFLKRRPRELSGGQRQRVALGRAIIRKPRVFLMDEPLSNLDARLRVEMRAELKRLHHELKITTIYVTHDQAEAMSLSDRIAVIHEGEIQQCGTPQEIYMKPVNTMVAGFMGSPPMNFLPAQLKSRSPVQVDCSGVLISAVTERVPEHDDVTIGIRPEDLTVLSRKTEGSVEVVLSIIESAGSFNWVDLRWGDSMIKGTSSAEEPLEPGGRGFVTIPEDRVMLFDRGTGRRI
ncbi:MAG: ABC transporter ATP-binding protein [Nitrospiraceae bacterium]|nr:MAG: ABC transporter ATP-binding protein [Nitrospiraceae bacterium]